jgi:5-methyltetrahydropteroyltriglutamate--homocysteine methyltransferase
LAVDFAQPQLDPKVLAPLSSKTVVLGVLDLSTSVPEPPSVVAERLRAALDVVPPERLVAAPDCGMKFLTRDVASAKLRAMVQGAVQVRAEL